MPRHPAARKVHRDPQTDDALTANMLEASLWARKNARVILIAAGAAALLVVGALYYMNYRATVREQAATRFNEVRQSAAGNPQLAVRDLRAFIDRFGGTPSGDQARLLLGQLYIQMDSASRAVALLEPVAEDLDEPAGTPAALLLGAAYDRADQHPKAEEVYLRIGREAPFAYQRFEALDRAAILRMQGGNPAGAADLYRQILTAAPDSLARRPLYELRLGEAEAAAAPRRS